MGDPKDFKVWVMMVICGYDGYDVGLKYMEIPEGCTASSFFLEGLV